METLCLASASTVPARSYSNGIIYTLYFVTVYTVMKFKTNLESNESILNTKMVMTIIIIYYDEATTKGTQKGNTIQSLARVKSRRVGQR